MLPEKKYKHREHHQNRADPCIVHLRRGLGSSMSRWWTCPGCLNAEVVSAPRENDRGTHPPSGPCPSALKLVGAESTSSAAYRKLAVNIMRPTAQGASCPLADWPPNPALNFVKVLLGIR